MNTLILEWEYHVLRLLGLLHSRNKQDFHYGTQIEQIYETRMQTGISYRK